MNIDDLWAQLETDLYWRQDELRLLSRSVGCLPLEAERDRARRGQLVMLYAHTEGYSKIALSTYIKVINDLHLKGGEVLEGIVASSLEDVFHGITYGDLKGKVFKEPLPEDNALHIFCRRRDFIASIESFLNRPVDVPEGAIDTESNLNSRVLRRNLYKLGFPVAKFAAYEGALDELVHRRHEIAHGFDINPVAKALYEKLQSAAFGFMEELTLSIVAAVEASEYLRRPVTAG